MERSVDKEKKRVRFHMIVEEVEDEGEKLPSTLPQAGLSLAQQAKRSRDWREWRQRKVAVRQRERALAEGPRWT
jgi:hypothetical protein